MSVLRVRFGWGSIRKAGRKRINQDFHGATPLTSRVLAPSSIAVALPTASVAARSARLPVPLQCALSWTTTFALPRRGPCAGRHNALAAINSWLHAQTQRSDARFDRDRGYVCTFSALIFKGREVHPASLSATRASTGCIHRLGTTHGGPSSPDIFGRVLPGPCARRGPLR
ncbi:hypothetical protein ACTMU2_04805 [Cupriavidus basilensis]